MRKTVKALLIVLCVVFSSVALFACGEATPEKEKINAPVVASKVYTGETLTAEVPANEAYTVNRNDGGINVGTYDVVLTLSDVEKYEWAVADETNSATVTLKFEITKADNEITELSLNGWVYGEQANLPTATAKFGTVVFTYAPNGGEYSETCPTLPGAYNVKASVAETENYAAAEKVLAFVIAKSFATIETAPVAVQKLVYNGEPQTLVTAGVAQGGKIMYKLGEGEWAEELPTATNAGKYTVYYKVVGDENHQDVTESALTASIAKAENAVTTDPVAVQKLVYNGEPQTLVTAGVAQGGKIMYKLGEGEWAEELPTATNAGEYTVYYKVVGDENYQDVAEATVIASIAKAENAVTLDTESFELQCGDKLPETFEATATFGTVNYQYAVENGEYKDLTEEVEFTVGSYTIKGYVVESENYKAGESKAVVVTVSHKYEWDKSGTELDEEKCACGQVAKTFNKLIAETNAQRIELGVSVSNGTAVVNETDYACISIDGISEYATIESVKLGEKEITLSQLASESELAGNKIALNVKDFGFAYGEQNILVTVKCDGGDTHEVKAKVLLVTAVISNKVELDNFGLMAKACEGADDTWGGYFELGANIDYNGYWTEFFNVKTTTELTALKGFVGVFDGMGYNIDRLYVARLSAYTDLNNNNYGCGAFISKLGKNGVLRNVSFTNARIGYDRSFLVYCGSGLIENIYVQYSIFGDDSYGKYSATHNWGQTSTMFARGEDSDAVVRNVVIDVSGCEGLAVGCTVAGYLIGQCKELKTYSNVYLVGVTEHYTNRLRDMYKGGNIDFEPGTNHFVYHSFAEMAADTDRSFEGFTAPLWLNVQGGLPYVNAQNIVAPTFTTTSSEITKGSSFLFEASANSVLSLSDEAITAGLTIENGTVTVPTGIANATYILTASSLFNPALKTEFQFSVINARENVEIVKNHEIDLNMATDGSVDSSKSVEIDLTESFQGNAVISVFKVEEERLVDFDNTQIINGKVTLNVAQFGNKYYGNKVLKLVFTNESIDYEYTIPVLFVTKYITDEATMQSVKTMAKVLQGGGYYRLANNVKLTKLWYSSSTGADNRIGVDTPFVGTLDGNGYAIDGLYEQSWTNGGFIQKLGASGVVKNIAFLNVKLGASVSIIMEGSGTIENVYVTVAIMPADAYNAYNSNWRGNETTIFGFRTTTNSFTLRNVLVDYTATSEYIDCYKDKTHAKLFGTFANSDTIENAVVVGMNKTVADNVTNSNQVYVAYTDGSNNGVEFPTSNWDANYWTVENNVVSWKNK